MNPLPEESRQAPAETSDGFSEADAAQTDEPAAPERNREFDIAKHGILLMKTGRLVVLLFLFASSLILFLQDNLPASLFVFALLAVVFAVIEITERGIASRLNIRRRMLTELEFRIFFASKETNALYISPFLRMLPVVCGLIAAILFYALHPDIGEQRIDGLLACLCASFVSGVSVTAPFAALNAAETLRRFDITIENYLCLSRLARARVLLADQSVFYGSKSAELRGFYADGALHPVADLDFETYLPLVLGFCRCDDGSLAAACGFRQSLSDVLLRAMRTTPMEHRVLLSAPSATYTPYDAETGVVAAKLTSPDGHAVAYRAGKPEAILPHVTRILDRNDPRPADAADLRRLNAVLRRIYEIGRQAIALAYDSEDGSLTFIGYLFVSSAPVDGAEAAVQTLRGNGVGVVYVSREHESCAFYRASALGVTNDMSRIITGARIDNFRPESLERAARRARIAAEMSGEHREALSAVISAQGETIIAASDDANDRLFEHADTLISVPAESEYALDLTARGCKITDIAEICRATRAACDAAVRAAVYMLCVPFSVVLFLLITSAAALPPLTVPAAVFLSFFIPLPFGYLIASRSASSLAPAPPPVFAAADKPVRRSTRRKPVGRLYLIWSAAASAFTALYAAQLYNQLAPVSNAGVLAASAAVFLTLLVSAAVNAAVSFVWGHSLFTVLDRKNRLILWFIAVVCAAGFGLLRIGAVNSLFSFGLLAFRTLPKTVAPAVITALVYELGALAARLLSRRGADGN